MRKLMLAVLLPLLLLLAQLGAVTHEFTHDAERLSHAAQHEGDQADKLCDLCLAFAAMHVPATASSLRLALLELDFAPSATIAFSAAESIAPAPHSRGPPAAA